MRSDVIRIDHIGLTPQAAKYCTLRNPPEPRFQIVPIEGTVLTTVFGRDPCQRAGDLDVSWLEHDTPLTGALLWPSAETMRDDA